MIVGGAAATEASEALKIDATTSVSVAPAAERTDKRLATLAAEASVVTIGESVIGAGAIVPKVSQTG